MSNRRTFIKSTSIFSGLLPILNYLPPFESLSESALKLEIYATSWGFKGTTEEFCQKAKSDGYEGIEVWIPMNKNKRTELLQLVSKYELKLGLLAGNSGKSFNQHLDSFETALSYATEMKPEFINCHSGRDYFAPDQGQAFVDLSRKMSQNSGIPIYHETHRAKLLFAAHIASQYFQKNENLRITLDISHWCNVHASLLDDQKEAVEMALQRTDHIHSRVGFQQAPQVPNHNDPQYDEAVKAHFAWWDRVVAIKKAKGEKLTMTTEFGPPPYMWTHPFTGDALADNWEVNRAMMHLWRERYQS